LNGLESLGFDPYFEAQLTGCEAIPARVAGEHRHGYTVWTDSGEGFARLSGRLMRDLDDEAHPGVGDWITLKEALVPGHTAIVDQILARRTVFTRGAAGREARRQVIAANVDIVFIVCGLDGDYNVHRIQRYLARVRASGAQPMVILNKTDVCDNTGVRASEVEPGRARRAGSYHQRGAWAWIGADSGAARSGHDCGIRRFLGCWQIHSHQRATW